MREKNRLEMYRSLTIGAVITMVIFALLRVAFVNAFEVVVFMAATWMIATYAAWTVIDILERGKK